MASTAAVVVIVVVVVVVLVVVFATAGAEGRGSGGAAAAVLAVVAAAAAVGGGATSWAMARANAGDMPTGAAWALLGRGVICVDAGDGARGSVPVAIPPPAVLTVVCVGLAGVVSKCTTMSSASMSLLSAEPSVTTRECGRNAFFFVVVRLSAAIRVVADAAE